MWPGLPVGGVRSGHLYRFTRRLAVVGRDVDHTAIEVLRRRLVDIVQIEGR